MKHYVKVIQLFSLRKLGMSSRRRSDDLLPLVMILLLKAMKGMVTARVGMRERRKEMRRLVPADRVVVDSLVSVKVREAGDSAKEAEVPEEMKNLSVSEEEMATGLERTVLTVFTELELELSWC